MVDFSNFTDKQLEKMLKDYKEDLANMIQNPQIHSQVNKIKLIEKELEKRKDGEAK